MYRLIEKRNSDAKFAASTFVSLSQFLHVFVVIAIIKKILNLNLTSFRFDNTYLINKLYVMPLLLVWVIVVYIFFNKRFEMIKAFYSNQKVITTKNTIIVLLLLIIPLILGILLLKK